ncbi:O-antigen ligase family protein [Methylobacterium sp. ID0610]|uniref:O-antigen ligase family protein n=1 Tax=Methylobacterium carpenticola TaxID=3344827 RepID=UPI003698A370
MSRRDRVFTLLVTGTAILAPLPYGSIGPKAVVIALAALAIALLLAPPRMVDWSRMRLAAPALTLMAAYSLIALLQSTPGALPAAEIWSAAAALLGEPGVPSFSVDADRTRFAIGYALLLALALAGGLGLAQIAGGSRRLLEALGLAGLVYALLGLVMQLAVPGYVLFTPKRTHLANLTGTFFNRNTEAAFLGFILMIHLALIGAWIRAELPFRPNLLRDAARFRAGGPLTLRLLAVVPILTALMMTGSRAGILTSLTTAASATVVMAIRLPGRGRRLRARRARRIAALAVVPLGLILAIGGAGLEARIRDEGLTDTERYLTYAGSVDLIVERWLAGHGAGTFELIFPAKRRAESSMLGIWNKAHSTLIEIAVEVGVPFALCVLAAFAAAVGQLARAAWREPSRPILLVGAVALVQSGLHSLVDYPLQIPGFALPVAVVVGAALGAAARVRREDRVGSSAGADMRGASAGQGAAAMPPGFSRTRLVLHFFLRCSKMRRVE